MIPCWRTILKLLGKTLIDRCIGSLTIATIDLVSQLFETTVFRAAEHQSVDASATNLFTDRYLTYSILFVSFYTRLKQQKTSAFVMFSGV